MYFHLGLFNSSQWMRPDVVLLAVINQRYSNQCASQIALKDLVTLGVMQLLGEEKQQFMLY